MTKMRQKLLKTAPKNCVDICAFSVFIPLKFSRVVDWGLWPPVPPPVYAPGVAVYVRVRAAVSCHHHCHHYLRG